MITRTNQIKTLIKSASCDSKCEFDSATCNSNQKSNNYGCLGNGKQSCI